jgi:heat shock protein HslJ
MPRRRFLPTRPLVAGLLVTLLTAACGSSSTGGTGSQPPGVEGRTFVGEEVRIEFRNGEISAWAGCNTMGGDYRIDGDRLVVGELAMTQMACPDRPDRDEWLSSLLSASPEVGLDGDELTLRTGTETLVLLDREVALPDRALTGTRWQLSTMIEGEVAGSVPVGVEAWIEFADDGTVGYDDGCNIGGGDVEVDGATLRFSDLVATARGCEGDSAVVQAAFGRVVQVGADVGYEIEASTLRLAVGEVGLHFAAE